MNPSTVDVPAWLRKPVAGFLTEAQTTALDSLFERLLPADHARQMPGATESKASAFVSQLLAMESDVYWEIPGWRQLYTDGLNALEQYARNKYQLSLIKLNNEQLDSLLAGLEAGTLSDLPATLDQPLLFKTLRRHCIQGCFADPRWGGNKERIMWRAIGYLQSPEDLYHD